MSFLVLYLHPASTSPRGFLDYPSPAPLTNFREISTPYPHTHPSAGCRWWGEGQLAPVQQLQTGNLSGGADWDWNPAYLPTVS